MSQPAPSEQNTAAPCPRVDVTYLVVPTADADEAESLAFYLNEHGAPAFAQADNEVNCPLTGPEDYLRVESLRAGWRLFWEHSDSGLFGLACYLKGGAGVE